MTDEKKLFRAIRLNKGKEEVFRYIYNKYKPLVFFVCSRFLKSEFDINDAVEETFIELFKNQCYYVVGEVDFTQIFDEYASK